GMDFVVPILKKWNAVLSTKKSDIVSKIIQEQKSKNKQHNQPLTTPFDYDYIEENGRIKKRNTTSRLNKLFGDYCLLSGSPKDALVWYKAAVDECKDFNDWEWVAASLESQ